MQREDLEGVGQKVVRERVAWASKVVGLVVKAVLQG